MTRLVVIGNGMVGSRFTADLLAADHAGRYTIDHFSAEAGHPYNRVLLSDVVSGTRDFSAIGMPQASDPRLTVHPGVAVTAIDREDRVVVTGDGRRTRYDQLVLATGARARVPALDGLTCSGDLPRGVRTLRTIDDARGLTAACVNARRAVVLGAGVLGLEVACGLARRGVRVTIVHPKATMMERQLDATAGSALTATLRELAIEVRPGIAARGVLLDADDAVRAVTLADGTHVPCDVLVIAAGAMPDIALAKRAGLATDRGVVVSEMLQSPSDGRVFAIGDCAQPPEGGSGLVAQGWSQARRLIARLTGAAPAPDAPAADDIVRLKAPGLDVVTMGVCGVARPDLPGHRRLSVSDPGIGRHIELVLHDGALVGATCVGAGRLATQLLTTYSLRTPLPSDPLALLLDRSAFAGGASATTTAGVVCKCNSVTHDHLEKAIDEGARDLDALADRTRAGTGCGSCRDDLCALLASRTQAVTSVKAI